MCVNDFLQGRAVVAHIIADSLETFRVDRKSYPEKCGRHNSLRLELKYTFLRPLKANYLIKYVYLKSKYFPNSDWLKAHA